MLKAFYRKSESQPSLTQREINPRAENAPDVNKLANFCWHVI